MELPKRKSIRLPEYDYAEPGAYFVTINCYQKRSLFGKLDGDKVLLNQYGEIAEKRWRQIPEHFATVALDAFIIMPSHVHGILFINELADIKTKAHVRARYASPVRAPHGVKPSSLGAIIGSYKSSVTREVHRLSHTSGAKLWHRNYYERVIRDERELDSIRDYTTGNPVKISYSGWLPESSPNKATN